MGKLEDLERRIRELEYAALERELHEAQQVVSEDDGGCTAQPDSGMAVDDGNND